MNPWILWLGFGLRNSKPPLSVFVELFWRDSMVDFDVGWNGRGLRKKSLNPDGKIYYF